MSDGVSFRLVDHEPDFKVAPGVKVMGRYELIDLLGMGGTANVWRGRVLGSEHQVAIKIQNPGRNTGAHRSERLEREFQLLNLICSPYVVAVSDYGTLPDGRAAVVFEHMRGSTLREVMEERDTFDLNEALDLAGQLLRALVDVHVQGIVHRDIKPDNIMILASPQGPRRLKLFDFGIAKVLSEDAHLMSGLHEPEIAELLIPLTSAEMTVGTPEYMAPEQISATNVGLHTDVYAVGIVLYEMLFGEVPYTGRNFFEIAHKHLAGILPPLPADLPEAVHELVWRSLACHTEDRYQNSEEMLRAIEAIVTSEEVSGWSALSQEEEESLTAFMSSGEGSTWTHVEDSVIEPLATDSSFDWSADLSARSIAPDDWLGEFSATEQTHALHGLEAAVEQRLGSKVEPPTERANRMRLSSEARRALTAQINGTHDMAAEERRRNRPNTQVVPVPEQDSKPPWEVHIDQGGADDAATEDLSLTDMLAVLNDRRAREGRRPFTAPDERVATALFVRKRPEDAHSASTWHASTISE